jgi:GNAT superfamily N-acetyltransferase
MQTCGRNAGSQKQNNVPGSRQLQDRLAAEIAVRPPWLPVVGQGWQMAGYTIRPVAAPDSQAVACLIRELGYELTDEEIAGQVGIYLASERSLALVAVDDSGLAVGLVSGHLIPLIHEGGSLGRITALIVSDEARGAGVGSGLLHRIDDWFQNQGCRRAEVTSGDQRHAAHRFYARHGFAQGERRFLKRYSD